MHSSKGIGDVHLAARQVCIFWQRARTIVVLHNSRDLFSPFNLQWSLSLIIKESLSTGLSRSDDSQFVDCYGLFAVVANSDPEKCLTAPTTLWIEVEAGNNSKFISVTVKCIPGKNKRKSRKSQRHKGDPLELLGSQRIQLMLDTILFNSPQSLGLTWPSALHGIMSTIQSRG